MKITTRIRVRIVLTLILILSIIVIIIVQKLNTELILKDALIDSIGSNKLSNP